MTRATAFLTTLGVMATLGTAAHAEAGDGVYCRLTSTEMRERLGAIKATLLERTVGIDELEDGYRFWLPRSEENLETLAQFVAAESACCPFFHFTIELAPKAERVSLAVTGPAKAKKMTRKMLESVDFDLKGATKAQ